MSTCNNQPLLSDLSFLFLKMARIGKKVTTQPSDPSRFERFLQLPAESRVSIYEYALSEDFIGYEQQPAQNI